MKLNCDSANKLVKSLMADLEALENLEKRNKTYSYKPGEEPEIPEYSLSETTDRIDAINAKIYKLKHAINVFNTTVNVPGFGFTMDEALVRLKVLNKRRAILNEMRSMSEMSREAGYRTEAEITKPNFNIKEAEEAYQSVNKQLIELQQAINMTNIMGTFEVDI